MEDPLIIKVLLGSLGSILAAVGVGIRYIFMQLHMIVPEEEIRRMIADQAAPQDVKQQMIYERLQHIEALLYALIEKSHDERRNNSHNYK